MVGQDNLLARNRVSSLTYRSAKKTSCHNIRIKARHDGVRQTFGPKLVFRFDTRERKTSVFP